MQGRWLRKHAHAARRPMLYPECSDTVQVSGCQSYVGGDRKRNINFGLLPMLASNSSSPRTHYFIARTYTPSVVRGLDIRATAVLCFGCTSCCTSCCTSAIFE